MFLKIKKILYWALIGWIIALWKRLKIFIDIVGWIRTILSFLMAVALFYLPAILLVFKGEITAAITYALVWAGPGTPAMLIILLITSTLMFLFSFTLKKEKRVLLKQEISKLIEEIKKEIIGTIDKVKKWLEKRR